MKTQLQKTEFKVQAVMLALALLFGLSIKAQYNYLGSYDSNGKPLYLETLGDVVSQAFLDDVDASLPESKPVPTYNPQYISSGTATDIQLRDSAAVWVTYVAEGAGYRNVLGFYTYDMTNPPLTVNDIQNETIIFPNVSERYSGGDLLPGDKVKLGDFSPGTGIGWFLIANGWNGSSVGTGNWKVYSNPDFNPEANASDRNHNVLLNDSINERIVLGFEDIRRDYASCDQDFNDAIFYVSANPYSAIITDSINTITDSESGVGSGGNGGLESNGDLASKIAVRNFLRQKTKKVDYNAFDLLPTFNEKAIQSGKVKSISTNKSNSENLHELLPTNSLFNTQALETTPADLLSITNAEEVFATDYVVNNTRKGAAMVMYTENKVYEHTKAVCDRLNGAELIENKAITINGNSFILIKLQQENGDIEYAVNFVVQEQANGDYLVDNHWALGDYQNASKNLNFQFWSSTTSMTVQLVQDALAKLALRGKLTYANQLVELPKVFVKKGEYKMGKLMLTIANETAANQVQLVGTLSRTETSDRTAINQVISLNGSKIQHIEIPVGKLFDIGFSLNSKQNSNTVSDVLYTADGAWGSDFETQGASLNQFEIVEDTQQESTNSILLERGLTASGTVKNYVSFFKNLKPSGKSKDVSAFNALQFKASGTQEIEITVMKSSIDSWGNQFKLQLNLGDQRELKTIFLEDLKSASGEKFSGEDIQSVAISLIGDGQQEKSFEITLEELAFVNAERPRQVAKNQLAIYPNPITNTGSVQVNSTLEESSEFTIFDIAGQIRMQQNIKLSEGINTIKFEATNWSSGLYFVQVLMNDEIKTQKFIVK